MRVAIIGGGPGGLYAGILLKAGEPSREVTVFERNAPDDTFGFGVVFSAATLSDLALADGPSHDAIVAACARWDPVEVRYRGERVRALGNRFAAVSRHRLLTTLQQRAAAVGVEVRFQTEVDPATVEGDLVIGADGVNSRTRDGLARHFKPRRTVEGSTFIWLGTTRPFDAFTFIFAETEHGLFQAHIYPFSERMSTFIVECDRDTWRRAGLDAAWGADRRGARSRALPPGVSDTHSIAVLEQLFAEHLDGHALVGNNSKWLDWTTVRTQTWRHGNVVLLGDAAHTAHFSIGSGTKLALEDAAALAAAIDTEPEVEGALADYESARKPAVERVQAAASASLDWFGRYRRYWGFTPPQFAYSLLTRSDRVDYDNLRRRDPDLVLGLERWLAEEARCGHDVPVLVPPPPALNPLRVGPCRLANRAVVTAEVAGDAATDAADGLPSTAHRDALVRAAAGGAALVLLRDVAVSADGRMTPADAGLYTDAHAVAWKEAVEAARKQRTRDGGGRDGGGRDGGTALLGVQLGHAGARGATRPRRDGTDRPLRAGAWPLVAASPLPYTTASAIPVALDAEGMARVRDDFATAASRAAQAGFDLLEVNAGHGYLLGGFLSPLTNRRDDAYGGDLDSRLRFPLEVVAAVRGAWPDDRALSVCYSASDCQAGGLSEEDAVEVARRLAAVGVDLLHVVAGQTTAAASPDYEGAHDAPYADLVRNSPAGLPVLVGGGIPTLAVANHLVAVGHADLCIVGTPAPTEPPWLARHRTR